jgi:acyl-CoA dehydrogenase
MRDLAVIPVRTDRRDEALREQVRAFLAEQLSAARFVPSADGWLTGFDPSFTKALASRGWVGLTIPVLYGGHGATALQRYIVIEELLAAGAPIAAHWFSDRQIAPALISHGTEEQKRRYLPAIAVGECFFCLGMSEPDAGSDLAAVRTRATRVEDGWLLNGSKVWTSGAHHAHAMMLLARTAPQGDGPKHTGLSQFVVDLPTQGVTIRPILLTSGAHHFNEVIFDNVYLPASALLGMEGQGWMQVTAELAYERSGPERFLSTMPLLTSIVRHQDELAITPLLAERLGGLLSRAWALRQLSLGVAGALSRGATPDATAALVKDLGTTFEQDVVDVMQQVVVPGALPGGSDIRRVLAQSVMQSPGFTLRGGTNEILRGVVARSLGLR